MQRPVTDRPGLQKHGLVDALVPTVTRKNVSNKNHQDSMEIVHKTAFPPYSITLKNSQHNEQRTDRKLVEHLILEWKNKNGFELDITGRFGHEKRILIFANNETTFEELFDQHKPSWNINEVQDELKITYPPLIKLTIMHSFINKPLNLVRADFCSLEQVKKLMDTGRISIGHMKNTLKQYHPPAKISKCMKCFSHHHNTKECSSQVQLCVRCGLNHPFNNNCQNEIKCVNCSQDHYVGHLACPEVRQIGQNQKIKRTHLLINQEQDQHLCYVFNKQTFPPFPSSPIQQQNHEDF
ncbi:unnamed protein product [Rotaria socialis]|uniref:Uncharacterized protein n=1 Tax=Rotaria socialis TaxID=392032 RepID=A0A821USI4_9BILA|nr:unnamed protein product [Rotaria socialis]